MQNYRALDTYRFLAASAVAIGHFNLDFRLGLENWTAIASRFGLFVDFFFILSGFVIALNYSRRINDVQGYGSFVWRRVARLWPLHMLVLGFFGALGLLGHVVGYAFSYPEVFKLSGLPWNVLMLQAWGPVWHLSFNVAAWSISAEMFVYLLFPVFALLLARLGMVASLGLIAFWVLAMIVARDAAGLRPWHQSTYDLGMLRAVPGFFLGVIIQRAVTVWSGRLDMPWWAAHTVFGLALVAVHLKLPAEMVIVLFAIFVFAMALAEERQPDTWLTKPIAHHLGQASYALYMVHMPLMTCMLFVIRRTTGFEGLAPWFFALGTFVLSLGLALALYRWFEVPMRDAMNRWSPFERRTQISDRRQTA